MSAAEGRQCHDLLLGLLTGSVPRVGAPDKWYQLSPGRSCFSICREPQLDAGHPQPVNSGGATSRTFRRICVGYQNASGTRAETRPLPSNLGIPPVEAAPYFTLFIAPVDTLRPRQKEHYMTTSNLPLRPIVRTPPPPTVPRVRSRLVLPPGVAAKPKLLSRQRNSSFMWWRSSAY